ncbi:MAG: M48 family metallopeptidase [Candidatus Marinimicrobia bacterium]|nr:M48 family metallopeptidase [Candidatus Neomarinimicrobiota bacterium]
MVIIRKSVLKIDGIGKVLLEYSKRARNVNISVKPYKGVRVAVPYGVSLKSAEKFVYSKLNWIRKNLERVKQYESKKITCDGSKVITTRRHILSFTAIDTERLSILIKNGIVNIRYPESLQMTDERVQRAIQVGVVEAYRIEAKEYLPTRVEYLAKKHGFIYNKVFIKNMKSRWGSCSSKNNINLNLQLMRLPSGLIDYVILYELVHTKVRNHSPDFLIVLNNVIEDAQDKRRQLKKYSL